MASLGTVRTTRRAEAPWSAREKTLGLTAGAALLVLLMLWEITRPGLPVTYELAAAPARSLWLARLPMAATAALAMGAFYIFLHITIERRVAVYATAILATLPVWFANARLSSGTTVPLALSALVFSGAGLAAFAPSKAARIGGVVVAAVATLAAVRFAPERGLLAIAFVPLAGVLAARALTTRSWWPLLVLAVVTAALGRRDLLLGAAGGHAAAFDAPVTALTYGLVPWTIFLPLSIAQRPRGGPAIALLVTAATGIAVHAALAPRTGEAPFVAIAALAGTIATALRSLEDAKRPSITIVAMMFAVGFLVAHDVGVTPERALAPFGAATPSPAAVAAALTIRSAVWLAAVLASIALLVPRTWLPTGRGLAIVTAGTLAGLVLRLHTYPGLLERLAPGAAFEAWSAHHRADEPLGLVGVDLRAVASLPPSSLAPQKSAPLAGAWLSTAEDTRRFLALAPGELPAVNAAYRAARGVNAPVLVGDPGAPLLAVSTLREGERSASPLDRVVLDAPPRGVRATGATLGDRLDLLGWDLTTEDGAALAAIPRGSRHAHLRLFFRSRDGAALSGHCTFVHIDNTPARFSAEHRELAYPMTLWRSADVIADDYDVKLPAQFHEGSYRLYVGVGVLPCEDDRRLHVTSGPSDGHDRINAGTLEVR